MSNFGSLNAFIDCLLTFITLVFHEGLEEFRADSFFTMLFNVSLCFANYIESRDWIVCKHVSKVQLYVWYHVTLKANDGESFHVVDTAGCSSLQHNGACSDSALKRGIYWVILGRLFLLCICFTWRYRCFLANLIGGGKWGEKCYCLTLLFPLLICSSLISFTCLSFLFQFCERMDVQFYTAL